MCGRVRFPCDFSAGMIEDGRTRKDLRSDLNPRYLAPYPKGALVGSGFRAKGSPGSKTRTTKVVPLQVPLYTLLISLGGS